MRLPIDDALPEILAHLARGSNLVLRAPPGAGKTTRVPPALLDQPWLAGSVIVLEPRRVAARAAARRIASERGAQVGGLVGYQVRFEDRTSAATRLAVLTEGLLTRKIASDPLLEGVGAVVLDEFHERSIHADLALAFLREIQETVRPELRLIVMSATLGTEAVAAYLGGCPVVDVPGRTHPVDVRWAAAADDRPLPVRVSATVAQALAAPDDDGGDVLVFLPGAPEIRRAQSRLAETLGDRVDLCPLYGDLPPEEQDRALAKGSRRKVILATNIAETSLTIEGVTTVVDAGLAKVLRHDPGRGMDRLELANISRASATQRAGRAGRTAPGRAYRMWTKSDEARRAEADAPEVARVDLAPAVLDVLGFAARDPAAFRWFEAPPAGALERAVGLLRALGAVDQEWQLTRRGRSMRALPVHPRLAATVLEAHQLGALGEGALAAALCAERDVVRRGRGSAGEKGDSDLEWRAARVGWLEAHRFDYTRAEGEGLDAEAARAVTRTRDRLIDGARRLLGPAARSSADPAVGARQALLAGFADRVARRRAPNSERVVLADGRGARLAPECVVRDAPLLVAVEVEDTAGAESLVRQAAAIEEAWLAPVTESVVVRFDADRDAVEAVRERRYRALVLASHPVTDPDPELVSAALAEAAAADPRRALGADEDTGAFLARLAFLRRVRPDLALPDLPDVLPVLCMGRRSFADLRRADAVAALRTHAGHAAMAALDKLAPDRLIVPTGSAIRLRYDPDPVLSVRLQEIFGWTDTPRVADIPVKLELLGPNYRPVQITTDLASFWDRTYPEVRKDLRARYPKHSWPENPREAEAIRGPRKRPRS